MFLYLYYVYISVIYHTLVYISIVIISYTVVIFYILPHLIAFIHHVYRLNNKILSLWLHVGTIWRLQINCRKKQITRIDKFKSIFFLQCLLTSYPVNNPVIVTKKNVKRVCILIMRELYNKNNYCCFLGQYHVLTTL